ncbi:MAG: hypothetical protein KAS32_31285 [Candidatus Peribacteraceae bacterium]|nr:hypothetical protein [Candidatus Peribacteraceae bacterium]
MEIEISFDTSRKPEEQYEANIKELPGSPHVGRASTPETAVAQVFLFNIKDPNYGFNLAKLDWEIEIIRKGY